MSMATLDLNIGAVELGKVVERYAAIVTAHALIEGMIAGNRAAWHSNLPSPFMLPDYERVLGTYGLAVQDTANIPFR